jgi:uncharacterized protein YndB with AHSA1/START domain
MWLNESTMPRIHQEIRFHTTPQRVYEALMDSQRHAAFTGAPAEISREPGGRWSAHGGGIQGRNLELVPDRRIVQSWRAGNWPEGVHSVVRFELEPADEGTKLTLTHDALPDEGSAHIDDGWRQRYWEPLAEYLERDR